MAKSGTERTRRRIYRAKLTPYPAPPVGPTDLGKATNHVREDTAHGSDRRWKMPFGDVQARVPAPLPQPAGIKRLS
jgi:hypothetical protein